MNSNGAGECVRTWKYMGERDTQEGIPRVRRKDGYHKAAAVLSVHQG